MRMSSDLHVYCIYSYLLVFYLYVTLTCCWYFETEPYSYIYTRTCTHIWEIKSTERSCVHIGHLKLYCTIIE